MTTRRAGSNAQGGDNCSLFARNQLTCGLCQIFSMSIHFDPMMRHDMAYFGASIVLLSVALINSWTFPPKPCFSVSHHVSTETIFAKFISFLSGYDGQCCSLTLLLQIEMLSTKKSFSGVVRSFTRGGKSVGNWEVLAATPLPSS